MAGAVFSSGVITSRVERSALEPSEREQRPSNLILEAGPERASRDGQGDGHLGSPADQLRAPDHVELDHGAAELGVDHALEPAHEIVVHVT